MIEIKDLTLAYTKDYNALQDVNLTIEQNEHYVIYGKENSGKSSLLRVMVGLEKPTNGQAYVKGIPATKVDFKDIVSLCYLPEKPVFMENKSVLKNLEYPLKIRKTDKNLMKVKLFNVLKTYGLDPIKNIKIKELSYFDRLKVCLARFALRTAEVYVIDDIFEKLDEKETKKIIEYIDDLIEFNNATSVIAVSNEKLIDKLGGKVVTISNGSLVEDNGK